MPGSMSIRRNKKHGFVADGYRRAKRGAEEHIRLQVEEEFAERLQYATDDEEATLRREMEKEIKRRVSRITPPDALY